MQMERGRTAPHLIQFDRKYVVKFKNNPLGDLVLVNEFVVYHLAKWLKLPIPEVKKVHVPTTFIMKNKALMESKFKPGTQFASRYIKNAVRLEEIQRSVKKRDLTNRKQAARIIVFDHWVHNTDRSLNGNLLFKPVGDKYKMYMIDNAQSFGKSRVPVGVRNKESFHWLYSLVNSDKELLSFAKTIQSFPEKEIRRILSKIPRDWNVSDKNKKKLYQHLTTTQKILPQMITDYIQKYARLQKK
jgi:hypothetical protein